MTRLMFPALSFDRDTVHGALTFFEQSARSPEPPGGTTFPVRSVNDRLELKHTWNCEGALFTDAASMVIVTVLTLAAVEVNVMICDVVVYPAQASESTPMEMDNRSPGAAVTETWPVVSTSFDWTWH